MAAAGEGEGLGPVPTVGPVRHTPTPDRNGRERGRRPPGKPDERPPREGGRGRPGAGRHIDEYA